MRRKIITLAWLMVAACFAPGAMAAENTNVTSVAPAAQPPGSASTSRVKSYVLQPTDLVEVTIYQEDDMGAKARLEKDGTIPLPLVGKVPLGGKTLDQASKLIKELLAKDLLVNPQVTVTILEYAKRRFTILGQVQRPGSYEMPSEEKLSLLQAIAMAGGYTRIAAPGKVTVQRREGNETKTFKLDAEAMSKEKDAKAFEVLPEDTITVGERLI
jgi:polysaccharide export outer membrane protein